MESIIDEDDTCESDMLGTTPPRARIRNKEKKRSLIELNKKSSGKTTKDLSNYENNQEKTNELSWSSKAARNTERDAKKDLEHVQAESLNVNAEDEIEYRARSPTLVESCNRFMCLTSKLKCQSSSQESALSFPENCLEQWDYNEDVPNYRVDFHRTFSMLIKMGNNDRNCKRALSVEEQVWENERKDLIWLELRAKIAGRSLQEQDNFLCSQRLAIPTVINNILDYRFKNQLNCHGLNGDGLCFNNESISGCVRITCVCCAKETSVALKEVGTLLESYHAVQSLYPSTKAMAEHHPIIAEERYENRLKAMCLWYNIAYNMRCKLVGMRKMLKFLEWRAKSRHRTYHNTLSSDSGIDQSKKLTQVKFDLAEDGNAHDSNNSTNSSSSSNDNTKENSDSLNNSVTPPLNQQGSPHATSDTTISSESGYNSDKVDNAKVVCYECDESFSVYDFNAVTQLRLLGNCTVSPYRVYINDVLKTQGLRKALMFIDKVQSGLAKRALLTFEKYNINKRYSSDENAVGNLGTATKSSFEYEDEINSIELRRFGSWSEETQNMRLPSYRSTFMLLATICMEVIYDYLEMRVECQPEKPNCMSIKQLIHELKEGLDIATEHRSLFLRNVNVALDGYEQTGESYEYFKNIVDKFDATVHKVLDKYFSYLTSWASMEHMSRALLDNEWAFTTKLASRMESLNQQTPQVFGNLAVIQIEAMIKRFSEKMWQTKRNIENKVEDVEPSEKRYQVYALCREVQKVFMCERELMLQTIQFSRSLSTVLRKKTEYIELREKLFEALMSSRDCLDQHLQGIIEKSDPSNFPEEAFNPDHNYIPIRIREVLLQGLKFGFELHTALYKIAYPFEVSNTSQRTSNVMRPTSLQIPQVAGNRKYKLLMSPETVLSRESYVKQYGGFHRELHRFIQDPHLARYRKENLSQTSSTESDGGRIRPKLSRGQSITESFDNFHPPQDSEPQSAFSKSSTSFGDTIDCSSNGRLDSDDVRRREQQWAVSVSRAIIDFATKWMKFVMSRCERGRGLRPRWANQGLEFLMLACDPRNTKHLTDNEFNDLKSKMDLCISHVIGSRGTNAASSPAIPTSPVPPPRRSNHRKYSNGGFESPMTPPTPGSILSLSSSSDHVVVSMKLPDETRHSERVLHALDRLERSRETLLMKRGRIGRVVTRNDGATTPKLRQVTFRWQRGIKIGQGSFGKVYTVVDTESGQLMAMKEVALCRGDRKAVQRAANELKVLEGITHPHLVRYYGCEIHQEEMLLFMELCVEGSLDALVARADGGLPEPTIRRYTKQLVAAIMALHNAHIVHRDIKSGNIFLTNEERCLKLGDFGCAVKIRGNTTAAGELIGHVGTQAYMAPEVFMKSSGHGRAADIWSLGCVVTEMASGKRPFSEYDNNYQIMFLVGMEGRPEIPERLSNEGKNFTLTCLTHDPEHRPTALELADHHFLKVKSDDDCNCDNNFKTPLYK